MSPSAKNIVVLGSTGSIGRQTLDVVNQNPGRLRVTALAAHSDVDTIVEQALLTGAQHVALADPNAADRARTILPASITVSAGPEAVVALAQLDGTDIVVNALVGAAGLRATLATLETDARLALANKESLVVGGEFVTSRARPGHLIPVDSEHSALFQCLVGESSHEVARLWLTASGGPFRGADRMRLTAASVTETLAHPRWTMGPKITVDSATLMNKGLEAIEAHHLFAIDYDRISIVVHPQSCVHSMIEFSDGSVKAHLGATDMRVPIQYALSFPERWEAPVAPVDFTRLGRLDFEQVDLGTFRCLGLALEAGRSGGTAPAALNAANEAAVAAFLAQRCTLTDIDAVVERVLESHHRMAIESVEQLEAVDAWARSMAQRLLDDLGE